MRERRQDRTVPLDWVERSNLAVIVCIAGGMLTASALGDGGGPRVAVIWLAVMVAAGATLGPPRGAGDRLLSAAAVVAAFVYGAATIVGLLAAWLLAETAAGRTRLVIPPDAPDTLIGLLDRFNGPIILWGVMFPVSAAVLELAARARRGILDVARAAWALGPAGVTRLKLLVAALAGLVGAIVAFGVKPG